MEKKQLTADRRRGRLRSVLASAIAVACIFMFSALLYTSMFQTMTRSKVEDFLQSGLREEANSVKLMTDHTKTLLPQIYYDNTASKLFRYEELSISEYMQSYYQLNRYRSINRQIESIYLYNPNTEKLFVSSDLYDYSEQSVESFCDQDIVKRLDMEILSSAGKPVCRMAPVEIPEHAGGRKEVAVFTFLYSPVSAGKYRQRNTVIVNFSQDILRNEVVLGQEEDRKGACSVIVDQEGAVAFSDTDAFLLGEKLMDRLDEAGVRYLEEGEEESGAVCRVDGQKHYMLKRTLPSLGWTILSVLPYSYITDELNTMLVFSLLVGIAVIISGFFLAAFLSRRMYKQIELQEKARQNAEGQRERELYRRETLRKLLQGKYTSRQEAQEAFQEYRLPFSAEDGFYLVIARIDRYFQWQSALGGDRAEAKKELLLLKMREASGVAAEGVAADDSELVWICEAAPEDGEHSSGALLSIWEKAAKQVEEEEETSFSLIVSDPVKELWLLPYTYRQTSEELFFKRTFFGHGVRMIATGLDHSVRPFPQEESKQVLNALKEGNIPEAKERYRKFVEKVSLFDLNYFNMSLIQLSSMLDSLVADLQAHYDSVICSDAFGFHVSRENIEVMEDIDELFFRVFDSIAAAITEKRLNKTKKMIEHARDLIQEQCGDPNFSSKTVTAALSVSYTSLSSAFRSYLSISLSNYILQVRIEKAKAALRGTEDPVAKVAEACGFGNPIYFHKVFKKSTGLTPGEFRNQTIRSRQGTADLNTRA